MPRHLLHWRKRHRQVHPIEAIAAHIGFGREGGNRNFHFETSDSSRATEPLARALRLGFFPARTGEGFYFRAESLFNVATYLDELGPDALAAYGGRSLHVRSHGETFFTVLDHKFRRAGLFLLDGPEAAISPQRQLAFLGLLHDTLRDYEDAHFVISTHSPVLLGFPGAHILSFDDGRIHPISFEEAPPTRIVRRFLKDRDRFLNDLFGDSSDPRSLFDPEP